MHQARGCPGRVLTVVTEQTSTDDGGVFTDEELTQFLRTQAALGQAYRIAAARSGAELLATSATSTGHGLGSDDPWVFGFQISDGAYMFR